MNRRGLHPGAWWLWAIGLAAAAVRTTNPLLLLLVVAVAGYVVAARGTDAPWGRSYGLFLRLGVITVILRVVLVGLFGARLPGHVILPLPRVQLPSWAAGVAIGGDLTLENLAGGLYEGLQLLALLACFGAANALSSPYRLLRCLPAAVYEAGVAITVALSFAPQAVISVGEIRRARIIRGRPARGWRGLRGLVVPVLEGALQRSLDLAASMDARGYGRRRDVPSRARALSSAATLAGLLALVVGGYALLDATTPDSFTLPAFVLGSALVTAGVVTQGRRSPRTRYRPDPWRLPEWVVAASGVVAVVAISAAGSGLHPSTQPIEAPALPLAATLAVLCAAVPAFAAPEPA